MASDNVQIRLHDARLESCTRQADDVLISITLWNEEPLRLRCRDVVLIKETIGGDLEELIECEQSELLREAELRLRALHYPENAANLLRHFRLLDDSNAPVLDVICQAIAEE